MMQIAHKSNSLMNDELINEQKGSNLMNDELINEQKGSNLITPL